MQTTGKARRVLAALALVAALPLAPTSAPAQDDTAWFYCVLAKSPYGDPTYYSSVFRADRYLPNNALENAFNSYISARHDPDAISGANCIGPYDGYQEAADEENDFIAQSRRDGHDVVLTRWAYRGE